MATKQKERPAGKPATIDIARLAESPWNTHGMDDDAADSLMESVRKLGVIQRLVVRPIYNGKDRVTASYEIVDGHRRYRAAKRLGVKALPCDIVELDDTDAQTQTLAANAQRIANDPLLEAELIQRMENHGMKRREIAAALGTYEHKVARRARLCSLIDGWREEYRKAKEKPSVATLEMIAAHEPGLQTTVLMSLHDNTDENQDESVFDDYEIEEDDFVNRMRKLDAEGIPFDPETAGCANCPNNTACHLGLFPEDRMGQCQNASCYALKWNTAIDAEIKRLRKRKVTVKEVKMKWDIPCSWGATRKKERKNTVPYVYEESGLKRILWSVPEAEKPVPAAQTEKEKAAAKAEKKRNRLVRSARDKMREEIDKVIEDAKTFRSVHDKIYGDLAALRLKRELERAWHEDSFVDDFARVWDLTCCLDEDEREAYDEAMEREDRANADTEDDENDGEEDGDEA